MATHKVHGTEPSQTPQPSPLRPQPQPYLQQVRPQPRPLPAPKPEVICQDHPLAQAEPDFRLPWYGIGCLGAVKRFFQKYAIFTGRASKREFWWALVCIVPISILFLIVRSPLGSLGEYLCYVWNVAIFIPLVALTTRRLHDANMSGGWSVLPVSGVYGSWIVLSVVMGGLSPDQILSVDSAAFSQFAAALFSSFLTIWSLCLFLAGIGIWVIVGLKASNPLGSRFDAKKTQDS